MQLTSNSSAFIEAQVYSQFILENLHDGILPEGFYRNVSDFPAGTTLNIKTVGSVTLQDVAEDEAMRYSPIDTGTVTLTITDYKGDGWYITDKLRQDGSQIEQLLQMRAMESTRAIQEEFETAFLSACNAAQTDANANNVNGFAHRLSSTETNNVASIDHFLKMKLAFDKANVPQGGRVAIVDPVVEATLNGLVSVTSSRSLDYNPRFQQWLEDGFATEHRFLFNVFGWDVWTSNRLPTGTLSDGTTQVSDAVANVFMNVMDDSVKPMMAAWRQMPKSETQRNKDHQRDEFVTTARYGIGAQRVDSLGVLITSASSY